MRPLAHRGRWGLRPGGKSEFVDRFPLSNIYLQSHALGPRLFAFAVRYEPQALRCKFFAADLPNYAFDRISHMKLQSFF